MNFDLFNKIAGALVSSLLVFMLLGFVGGKIFHGGGGHGDEQTLAFALDIEEETTEVAEAEEEAIDLAALTANADPAAGEKVFNKCRACHKIEDGANGVGPHLWNVLGRDIASVDGYNYSEALGGKEGEWDLATMSAWLENPNEWAPGNIMGNAGAVADAEDRVNLIAYLNQAGDAPIELAAAAPEAPAEDAAASDAAEDQAGEAAAEEAQSEAEGEAGSTPAEGGADAGDQAAAPDAANGEEGTAEAEPEPAEQEVAAADATGDAPADSGAADIAGDGPDLAGLDMLAGADVAAGEAVFRQCRACHQVQDGRNGVGPHLYNLVGREIAAVDGYRYSDALANKEGVWDPAAISAFIENPREWAPGTKMGYAGLDDAADRANVIAWLAQQADEPLTLPSGEAGGDEDRSAAEPDTQTAAVGAGETNDRAAPETDVATGADAPSDEGAAQEGTAEDAGADETTADEGASDQAAASEEAAAAATEEVEMASAVPASSGEYADLLASADADAGSKIFRQCRACHQVKDGARGVGPHLWNVVGRDVASVDGFRYSDALAGIGGAWTLDKLMAWLENPREFAPGNKMAYAGIGDEQDRINLIVYLNEAGDDPQPLD